MFQFGFRLALIIYLSGNLFSPEWLCADRPDSSHSHQWVLHSDGSVSQSLNTHQITGKHKKQLTDLFVFLLFFLSDDAVDQNNASPDFYINICQPLNPIPGVTCPPGAAVCMDPDNGPPKVEKHQMTTLIHFIK